MASCICIFGETAHVISPLQLSNGLAQVARRQICKTLHIFFASFKFLFIHAPLQDAITMQGPQEQDF